MPRRIGVHSTDLFLGLQRHHDELTVLRRVEYPAELTVLDGEALDVFAHSVGFAVKDIVLLYALFNISFVVAAPLVGKLGDRMGRARIIMLGYLIYLLMSLGFALATTEWQIIVLFVIYGVFYSVDEAQSKAFIADIELERRASAIAVYDIVTGIIYLPASLIAGALWLLHPASAFIVAACFAFFAIAAFVIVRPDLHRVSGAFPG